MEQKKIDKIHKEFVQLEKRYWEISQEIKKFPWVELEKPIFDGYILFYVLREDIQNSDESVYFQEAIDVCQINGFCKNKEKVKFLIKNYKNLDEKNNFFMPKILHINEKQYVELSDAVKKYFKHSFNKYSKQNEFYLDVKRYFLVLTYKKKYLTKVQNIPLELIEERKNILKLINSPKYKKFWKKSSNKFWKKYSNGSQRTLEKANIKKVEKMETYDEIPYHFHHEYARLKKSFYN